MKPKREQQPIVESEGKLDPELARILSEVGPANYGLATARLFVRGAKFGKRRERPRYAIT